ncbi:MAG: CHAD domain-containing protein, partial [Nocardioidaceae bacterium]
ADLAGGVHGMRVAIRRLRDALATHRPLLDATVTDPVRDELRWLARSLGPARDAEVQRRRVMRQVAELAVHDDGELVRGPVLARVEQHLTEHETRARSAVLEILDGERYRILLGTLVELVADPPFSELATQPATEVLRARAKHDLKRLRARVRAAEDLPDRRDRPAALHEARKAAKRARYAAEPLVAVVGRPARRYVKAVKRVQSALGDHHDAVVAQALLRDLADEAATAGENGFSYGELHRRESEAQSAGEQRFEDAWRRVSRKKRRRWLG